jgi:hypothetical protein
MVNEIIIFLCFYNLLYILIIFLLFIYEYKYYINILNIILIF